MSFGVAIQFGDDGEKQMQDAICQFRDGYADKLAGGMAEFVKLHGQTIIRQLHDTITESRRTIYLFGNGGSHAIGKCIEYGLQDYAREHELPLRIQTGVDTYQMPWLASDCNPGLSFINTLRTEGADSTDLIVLISGSGNSDNLCDVANYAKRVSIPTFAIVGSNNGKLRDFIPPNRFFCVSVEDQQISEDIIQSVALFLDQSVSNIGRENWNELVTSQTEDLKATIKQIPASFMISIAEVVSNAFSTGQFVWILGLDHPVLNVCAEHTAHNLYWDSIYEVDDPPQRLIFSSPTACDFSGISNDRRRRIIENIAGLSETKMKGVALVYSMKLDSQAQELLESLEELNIPTFVFSAESDYSKSYRDIVIHNTKLEDPQSHAGLSQILGHMLGRMVRMKLRERSACKDDNLFSNPARFLLDFDLAQRRLLDG